MSHASDAAPDRTRRREIALAVAGLGVSALAVFLLLRGVDLRRLGAAFAAVGWGWAALAALAVMLDYLVRAWRWGEMLRAEAPGLAARRCIAPFFASMALNGVLPLRVGDIARAVVFPASLGVSRAFATGVMVVERLFDLAAVLLLFGIGLAVTGVAGAGLLGVSWPWLAGLGAVGIVACAVGFALIPAMVEAMGRWAVFTRPGPARLLAMAETFSRGVEGLRRPGRLALLTGATGVAWALDALVFYCAFRAVGAPLNAGGTALVGASGVLSTLIPSTPGYIGTFHLAVQTAAQALGVGTADATAAAVLSHGALWLVTLALGALSLLTLGAGPLLRRIGQAAALKRETK